MNHDVFFLSHDEPERDVLANMRSLIDRAPDGSVRRVEGVVGIHAAHAVCASRSDTEHFFVVDADAFVEDAMSFEPDFEPDPGTAYVWRSRNAVNGLVYGYGGIKLLPRAAFEGLDSGSVDMTTSLPVSYAIVDVLGSETRFNTGPYEAYKSGFREAVKLASGTIRNRDAGVDAERLTHWCARGIEASHGFETIVGARMGRAYGRSYARDPAALARINDFVWLREHFETDGRAQIAHLQSRALEEDPRCT